jgi:hypothetical protein
MGKLLTFKINQFYKRYVMKMLNKIKKLDKLWTQNIEPYKDIVGLIMGAVGSYCTKISFNMKPFCHFLIFGLFF